MPERVLIVDDDPDIRDLLREYLRKNGYRAECVPDGREMRSILESMRVDLVVLDVMLPGDNGLMLCRNLRARPATARLPILMLTARGDETDRIVGLEMGADDYLAKPFNPRELLARVRSILRRVSLAAPPALRVHRFRFAGWVLDVVARHLVSLTGLIVPLSGAEYRLLRVFLDHPNRVLNRDQLLDLTQGREALPFDRSIDVLVSRLRRHLRDDAREPRILKTVRGEGYILAASVESEP